MTKAHLILYGGIGAITLLAILVLTGVIPGLRESEPPTFTLTVWGAGDPEDLWQDLARKFREQNPSASVTYVPKDPGTYETELVNALAAGKGPDIFILPDVKIADYRDKIRPLAEGALGYQKRALRAVFPDELLDGVTGAKDELLGTPLAFDTLGLFYNRDYFNAANIPFPPATWDELVATSRALTRFTESGGIRRSGVALGTAANVAHAEDILLALIYQSGGAVIAESGRTAAIDNPATASALEFYGAFADSTKRAYSWNAFFAPSLDAFARGDTAMVFGYAADAKRIFAKNPQLNFDVAPLPRTARESPPLSIGRFSVAAVARLSPEWQNAWRFLLWLQRKDAERQYIDALGLPPGRRDLVNAKPPREYLSAFYGQTLSAKTFPLRLGASLPAIIRDMIDEAAERRFSRQQIILRASQRINELLATKENQ